MKKFSIKFLFIVSFIFISLFLLPKETYAMDMSDYEDITDLDIQYDPANPMKPIYITQYDKAHTQNLQKDAWNETYDRTYKLLVGLSGLFTLVFVQLFIMNALKLGATAGNPQERQKVLKGLLWNGLGAGGFAISGILMALAFRIFQ